MADMTCVHCGSELHASNRCPYVTDIPLDALARLAEYRDANRDHMSITERNPENRRDHTSGGLLSTDQEG